MRGPKGLSPRVRGNRHAFKPPSQHEGSIPACAGEPPSRGDAQPAVPGSIPACAGEPVSTCSVGMGYSNRSIPACAGEPCLSSPQAMGAYERVYPRVCGGTQTAVEAAQQLPRTGLSPRVRGNRISCRCIGDTPASGVYPRVCGGTVHDGLRQLLDGGLSPRVRGNYLAAYAWDSQRSAGLSPRVRGNRSARVMGDSYIATVYPRVCGGTC